MTGFSYQKEKYLYNMKHNEPEERMVLVPEKLLLSLVADRLKDKGDLFPRSTAEARRLLQSVKSFPPNFGKKE